MAHNPRLADQQEVGEFERKLIDKLHILRYLIESNVIELMETEDSEGIIKHNYEEWLDNEKILQKLWKFKEDDNYIKFWTFPACSCPKMDNDDAYPTGRYVTSQGCLIHGWADKNE